MSTLMSVQLKHESVIIGKIIHKTIGRAGVRLSELLEGGESK